MKIYIDADGCPVVDITIRIAKQYKIQCIIVCDTAHVFQKDGAKTITVSKGPDSVDFTIVKIVDKGDVVITQDYGLAAMCLVRGAIPISQNGIPYDNDNIDDLMAQRHVSKLIRMSGGKIKRQPKRKAHQGRSFDATLREILDKACLEDKLLNTKDK